MIIPESYFTANRLYDKDRLRQHCAENLVYMRESDKFPDLAMLHYAEEAHFEQKWNPFNLMCRGLIVDLKNNKILAYPFNKFFNIGERPETQYSFLEREGSFEVSEKLDGSLLILFKDPTTGKFFVTTKGSFDSEHGEYATKRIPDQLKADIFVDNYTLMFELISKKYQIVIDYEKKGYPEALYLVGVRHLPTNMLLSYKEVQEFAMQHQLYTIKTYLNFKSLDEIIEDTKHLPVLDEGYVIRFKSNGLMVKVKGAEYLRVHRFISRLSPKFILEALGGGNEDELIKLAPEEYREDVVATIKLFKKQYKEITKQIYSLYEYSPVDCPRKVFALWVMKEVPSEYRSFMFTLLDGRNLPDQKLYKLIGEREKVSTETMI